MRKSGLADSPLFAVPQKIKDAPTSLTVTDLKKTERTRKKGPAEKQKDTTIPSQRATKGPRSHDTTKPRYHDATIESVRKAVKEFGKEAATHRFTAEEKKAIADIIYAYKTRGIKTSENEIARIAVNFLLDDYRENGEHSVLRRVLKALNR